MSNQKPEHCNDCEHIRDKKEHGKVWYSCCKNDARLIGLRLEEWKNVKINAPHWCPLKEN